MAETGKKQAVKTRLLGTVVPVGALRGGKSTAVGEFPDLVEFARLCKKMKIGLIQLLPVNEFIHATALKTVALYPNG